MKNDSEQSGEAVGRFKRFLLNLRYFGTEWHVEECPECGDLMRLGRGWLNKESPPCPKCADNWEIRPKMWSP